MKTANEPNSKRASKMSVESIVPNPEPYVKERIQSTPQLVVPEIEPQNSFNRISEASSSPQLATHLEDAPLSVGSRSSIKASDFSKDYLIARTATEPNEPSEPYKAKPRKSVVSGPIATADIGSINSRFSKRVAEKKKDVIETDFNPLTEAETFTTSSHGQLNFTDAPSVDSLTVEHEIQGFLNRKQQLEAMALQSNEPNESPIVQTTRPSTPNKQVLQSPAARVITVKSTTAKPPLPDAPLKSPSPATPSSVLSVDPPERPAAIKQTWTDTSNDAIAESQESLPEKSIKPEHSKEKERRPSSAKDKSDGALNKTAQKESNGELGVKPESTRDLTTEDKEQKPIPANKLPSLEVTNVYKRLSKEGILRCKLYRKKNLLEPQHPTYMLHNEFDNKMILCAKKRMLSKTANYIISDFAGDISKDSIHYLGKIK